MNLTERFPNYFLRRHRRYLLVLVLLGMGLRLYRLGADSLWYDETVSAYLASLSAAELIAHTARDIHPPGYYLLLRAWSLVAGRTEFALAYFSLFWGVLLIPLTVRLARYLTTGPVASWAALLLAISPFNVWYSQEVRMYTLGAMFGLVATTCLLRAVAGHSSRFWLGYSLAAAAGLYSLYYFAFLLITINVYIMLRGLSPDPSAALAGSAKALRQPGRGDETLSPSLAVRLGGANLVVLLLYLPWLPIAWQQATHPPVPPWRTMPPLTTVLLESSTALVLGQSVAPGDLGPILLLALGLALTGTFALSRWGNSPHAGPATGGRPPRVVASSSGVAALLLTTTFGPLLLIYLLSFVTPLYHVRYLFTTSPAFTILLGAGLAWLKQRSAGWSALAAAILIGGSGYSLYQLYTSPAYRADDFRAAVAFLQEQWQPGDAILINAGYTYPAFLTYATTPVARQRLVPYPAPRSTDRPLLLETGALAGPASLGWGDPQSDFYAASAADTLAALGRLSHEHGRLWQLRAYDTVTDPHGLIRQWLAGQAIPIEDRLFSGESNIRVQGFLFPAAPPPGDSIPFEDGMTLRGWSLSQPNWQAGQTLPVKLWWSSSTSPSVDYKASLKLWNARGELAAQGRDEWPGGTLYRSTAWSPGQVVYHPMSLILPPDLPSGQYWLNVELYHPDTIQPLPRAGSGEAAVTLVQISVRESTSNR
jgi:hypothetical protein